MSFTVVPLHNLALPAGSKVQFGEGYFLQDFPDWLRHDPEMERLSFDDRESALRCAHALIAEYCASTYGEKDPNWTGRSHRTIQRTKSEAAILANFSLWLAKPSKVCLTNMFHAISGVDISGPIVCGGINEPPIYCHPNDFSAMPALVDVIRAGQIHSILVKVPRLNSVWTALRAFWAALTTEARDIRYLLFWVGLEALFGSDDGREISYKLAQRIAFFLCDSPDSAKTIFREVKKCYSMRSQIAHGRWEDSKTFDDLMSSTERYAREVFRRLIDEPTLMTTFISKHLRDKYLEEFVFSNAAASPPVGPGMQ